MHASRFKQLRVLREVFAAGSTHCVSEGLQVTSYAFLQKIAITITTVSVLPTGWSQRPQPPFFDHLTFNFSSTSAGLKHGFFRRLSWCCIRLCLIFSLGGVVSPAPRVMGAVLSAALPGITLATAASAAVYSQGGVSRGLEPGVRHHSLSVVRKFLYDATLGLGVRRVLLRLGTGLVQWQPPRSAASSTSLHRFPSSPATVCRWRNFMLDSSEGNDAIFWFPLNSSKSSCCWERAEHLFENAKHLAGLRICRPGEIPSASTTTQPAPGLPCARLGSCDHALA